MIILWIKRAEKDEPYPGKERKEDSFHEHDERMKRFRVVHPKVEPIKTREGSPANLLMPLGKVKVDQFVSN